MDALHSALEALGPIDFDREISGSDDDQLRSFTRDLLTKSSRVVEPVPRQASINGPSATGIDDVGGGGGGGGGGHVVEPPRDTSGLARDIEEAQRGWGRPLNRADNERDNPLRVPVYKLPSRDGKGAWFARRSIHRGMSFGRWKEKLQDEFAETMRIRERNGGRLEGGSVRGIGCERRLEKIDVPANNNISTNNKNNKNNKGKKNKGKFGKTGNNSCGEDLGTIEVYCLSASFTGPSTPRDFVSLLLISDRALDVTHADGKNHGEKGPAGFQRPKNYTIISKPCKHSAAPPRKGFVRGQYESIECIREVTNNTKEENNLSDASKNDSDADITPVEWIMITRSDPGGSIPRWLIERGTTPSIVDDARKFMEWARRDQPDNTGYRTDSNRYERLEAPRSRDLSTSVSRESQSRGTVESHVGRVIDGVAGLLTLGLEAVTPVTFYNYLPGHMRSTENGSLCSRRLTDTVGSESNQDGHQGDSRRSFAGNNDPTVPERNVANNSKNERNSTTESNVTSSANVSSSLNQTAQMNTPGSKAPTKDLAKLAKRRRETEEALETLRKERLELSQGIEKRNSSESGTRPSTSSSVEPVEANSGTRTSNTTSKSLKARLLTRLPAIDRKEAKLNSRLAKIERQEQQATAQADAKRRKDEQKRAKQNAESEVEVLKEESRRLADELRESRQQIQQWKNVVGRLQTENTRIVAEKRGRSSTDRFQYKASHDEQEYSGVLRNMND